MKEIRRYKTQGEAHFDAGLLLAQGIPCEVRDGTLVTHESILVPAVWILRDEDHQLALEVLDYRPNSHGWPWNCPACNSKNGPQFDACWSCGADRPRT